MSKRKEPKRNRIQNLDQAFLYNKITVNCGINSK